MAATLDAAGGLPIALDPARVEELDDEKWGCKLSLPPGYWDVSLELRKIEGTLKLRNALIAIAGHSHEGTKRHS